MHEVPAHHRKFVDRLLARARAELASRQINTDGKSALEIFALRAAERRKERHRIIANKEAAEKAEAATFAGKVGNSGQKGEQFGQPNGGRLSS